MPPKAKSPRTGGRTTRNRNPYNERPRIAREYGLLRHGMSKVPALFVFIEVLFVHLAHLFTHGFLAVCVVLEACGVSGGRIGIGAGASYSVTSRLCVFAYDTMLGFAYAVIALSRFMGLAPAHSPSIGTSVSLLRLAVLQENIASALHFSSMARWQHLPSDFLAPPLLPCLAYFFAPWSTFSMWLINVQSGDHAIGLDVKEELLLVSLLLVARSLLFGRHGFPRMPKGGRHSLKSRLVDILVLGSVAGLFDHFILHSSWLERRHHWKYVFCAVNVAWPIFYGAPIVASFRHQGQFIRSDRREMKREKPKPPSTFPRTETVASNQAPPRLPVAGLPTSAASGVHSRVRPRRIGEDTRSRH